MRPHQGSERLHAILALSGWIPALPSSASPAVRQRVAGGDGCAGPSTGLVTWDGVRRKACRNLGSPFVVPMEGAGRGRRVRGRVLVEDKACMESGESTGDRIILRFMELVLDSFSW